MKIKLAAFILILITISSCHSKKVSTPSITKIKWGRVENKEIWLYTLTNKNGMEVKISNFGGAITIISVPDKTGKLENVALGFDSLRSYFNNNAHFGCLIGRYANRIAKGKFTLNGKEYSLALNNGVNHIHGGIKGFDVKVWDVSNEFASPDSVGLTLSYLSKDMEEGYPGNLMVKVNYLLTNNNEIGIRYTAETDKPTVLNLTNHSYFNLTGCKETVLNHELILYADSITLSDSTFIPVGKVTSVKGTCYDFTTTNKIGERIAQIPGIPGGYDSNFKIRKKDKEFAIAAEVYEPMSGRVLQVYTTEPGIQFYTGNFLNTHITGHNGMKYQKHFGFCLEAQHYPDSPNQLQFPTVTLNPGEKYTQYTVYKFSTR